MISQAKENKGVELTGHVYVGSGAMRRETKDRLVALGVLHPPALKASLSLSFQDAVDFASDERHEPLGVLFQLGCR
jgi:hypothetical protein